MCILCTFKIHFISFFFLYIYRKEIRDIRRQIKHNNGANKQRMDRAITTTSSANKTKVKQLNKIKQRRLFDI